MNRSLVCSIGEHASCDGNTPNGPAGIGYPCECACGHRLVLPADERDRERLRAQQRARLAERIHEPAPRHVADEPTFGCAFIAGFLIAAIVFLAIGLAVGYAYGHSAPRPAAIPTASSSPSLAGPPDSGADPATASPGASEWQSTGVPTPAPTGGIGTVALAGTAAWYVDGPGRYGALRTFELGDRPFVARVSGPAGVAAVTIRDHCVCVVDGRVRLIDLSPAAFTATCGPLGRGTCTVEVEVP